MTYRKGRYTQVHFWNKWKLKMMSQGEENNISVHFSKNCPFLRDYNNKCVKKDALGYIDPSVNLVFYEIFKKKKGFHAVCYISTMPRLVQIETCFFWIINCISNIYNSHFFSKIEMVNISAINRSIILIFQWIFNYLNQQENLENNI